MKKILNWITVTAILVSVILIIKGMNSASKELIHLSFVSGIIAVSTAIYTEIRYKEQ